jgi:hypothetical protein
LEPSGQKFATPIKVSFRFDAQDLKGIIPEALAVAYQDKTGVWQTFKTVWSFGREEIVSLQGTDYTLDILLRSKGSRIDLIRDEPPFGGAWVASQLSLTRESVAPMALCLLGRPSLL